MRGSWIGEGVPKQRPGGRLAGKWRVQWAIVEPGAREPTRIDKSFDTRGEALKWRDETKERLIRGLPDADGAARSLTLEAWFSHLAGTKEGGHRDGAWCQEGAVPLTVATKVSRWNAWVKGTDLAATPLLMFDRERARRFLATMRARNAPLATRRDVIGLLKKVVNDAIRERDDCSQLRNPFVGLSIVNDAERTQENRERQSRGEVASGLLGPKEARAALAKLDGARERALFAVAVWGGLRLSEIMALCVEQVDAERGVILVDRAVKIDSDGGQEPGLPKGNKVRIACACPELVSLLLAAAVPGRRHLFGAALSDDMKMKTRFYVEWGKMRTAAGLPAEFTPQTARETHNNWIEKLMPYVSLSTRLEHMGHSVNGTEGGPKGLGVNIRNYTGHIPEGIAPLRKGLQRIATGRGGVVKSANG